MFALPRFTTPACVNLKFTVNAANSKDTDTRRSFRRHRARKGRETWQEIFNFKVSVREYCIFSGHTASCILEKHQQVGKAKLWDQDVNFWLAVDNVDRLNTYCDRGHAQ